MVCPRLCPLMGADCNRLAWTIQDKKKGQNPCFVLDFLPALDFFGLVSGGEDEDRTHDLRIANAALSQLSYPPNDDMNFTRAISYRQ